MSLPVNAGGAGVFSAKFISVVFPGGGDYSAYQIVLGNANLRP